MLPLTDWITSNSVLAVSESHWLHWAEKTEAAKNCTELYAGNLREEEKSYQIQSSIYLRTSLSGWSLFLFHFVFAFVVVRRLRRIELPFLCSDAGRLFFFLSAASLYKRGREKGEMHNYYSNYNRLKESWKGKGCWLLQLEERQCDTIHSRCSSSSYKEGQQVELYICVCLIFLSLHWFSFQSEWERKKDKRQVRSYTRSAYCIVLRVITTRAPPPPPATALYASVLHTIRGTAEKTLNESVSYFSDSNHFASRWWEVFALSKRTAMLPE